MHKSELSKERGRIFQIMSSYLAMTHDIEREVLESLGNDNMKLIMCVTSRPIDYYIQTIRINMILRGNNCKRKGEIQNCTISTKLLVR